jgi:hypothetical protein
VQDFEDSLKRYPVDFFKDAWQLMEGWIMGKQLGKKSSLYFLGVGDSGESTAYEVVAGLIPMRIAARCCTRRNAHILRRNIFGNCGENTAQQAI